MLKETIICPVRRGKGLESDKLMKFEKSSLEAPTEKKNFYFDIIFIFITLFESIIIHLLFILELYVLTN